MNYYSNTDIADELNVSGSSIGRWVDAALEGKNSLEIQQVKGKYRIIKNPNNYAELFRLREKNVRYRTDHTSKEITVSPEFYSIFDYYQSIQIINSLELKSEIPLKFCYMNKGAIMWNNFIADTYKVGIHKTPSQIAQFLDEAFYHIQTRNENLSKINIIDIGPGNSLPVKNFIYKFYNKGLINSYIGVDISKELLKISEQNITLWFPGLQYKAYVRDIEKTSIEDILFENSVDKNIANIVFIVGSTYGNLTERTVALKNLSLSLNTNDLLMISKKLDNALHKTEFGHLLGDENMKSVFTWIPKLLGIDLDLCELRGRFDETTETKLITLRPDKEYILNFEVSNVRRAVTLDKGKEIVIWRNNMSGFDEFLKEIKDAGLVFTHITTDKQNSNTLVTCQAV